MNLSIGRLGVMTGLFVGGALLACAATCVAREWSTLNPASHRSWDGGYELRVDPTTKEGSGPGTHELLRDGKSVWKRRLAVTLWEAAVGDNGFVAGYAYSDGKSGIGEEPGHLHLMVIHPQGAILLNRKIERNKGIAMHEGPLPMGAGVMMDSAGSRAVFRIKNPKDSGELWSVYDLATKRLGKPRAVKNVIHARSIPDRPLTLIQSWIYENGKTGAGFRLVDADGRKVWELRKPGDYDIPEDEDREDALRRFIWRAGAILETAERGRFELYFAADSKRAAFRRAS